MGTEICKQLLEAGHEPVSVSRSRYPHLEELGVESYQADLSQDENLSLEGFEAIVHCAAKAGVWGPYEEYYQANFKATQNMLMHAQTFGIKYFVYTSSPSVVFGKEDIENGDESLPYPKKFYTSYAKTKAMAEKEVLESNTEGLKTCSIRPHLIWGEGDPHLIPRLIEKARAGKLKIVGNKENLVDVIHVKNAARAHVLALEAMVSGDGASGKSFFVGQEDPVNLWDFINRILFEAGLEGVEDQVSFGFAYSGGFALEKLYALFGIRSPEPPMTRFVALQLAKHHYFSHQLAKDVLGYKPVISTEEGLSGLFWEKKEKLRKISKLENPV